MVSDRITDNLPEILPHNSDNSFYDYRNACIMIEAAWPPEDLIDGVVDKDGNRKQSDIEYFIEHGWFKNKDEAINKFKTIIKEYFPWNLNKKTKEIKLYSELETD